MGVSGQRLVICKAGACVTGEALTTGLSLPADRDAVCLSISYISLPSPIWCSIDGKVVQRVLSAAEVDALIAEVQAATATSGDA